jgi:hypothetical protein
MRGFIIRSEKLFLELCCRRALVEKQLPRAAETLPQRAAQRILHSLSRVVVLDHFVCCVHPIGGQLPDLEIDDLPSAIAGGERVVGFISL